jgi:cytochrome P450
VPGDGCHGDVEFCRLSVLVCLIGPVLERPFGAGGRKCVGYKFAEQEMMLVGACLFQAFTLTRPPGDGPLLASTGVTHAPIGAVKVLLGRRA